MVAFHHAVPGTAPSRAPLLENAAPVCPSLPRDLSVRERQTMDALYRLRRATVAELVDAVPGPVTYSAVRAVLRTLREKGHVTYREDGPRYVYRPAAPRAAVRARALQHLVRTFFDGSAGAAALALLDRSDLHLTDAELRALDETIERAAKRRTRPPRSAAPHGPAEQDRPRRGGVARRRGPRGTATTGRPTGTGYGDGGGEGRG